MFQNMSNGQNKGIIFNRNIQETVSIVFVFLILSVKNSKCSLRMLKHASRSIRHLCNENNRNFRKRFDTQLFSETL